MKAAVLEKFGAPLVIKTDFPDPECGPTDVVIKVEANGVCRSDYHLWQGGFEWLGFVPPLPTVLGHEYCGVVEEAGRDVRNFKKGDRVTAPFNHSCGTCEFCQSGHQNVCSAMTLPMFHYSGGFAQYTKVPNADVNCVRLPDALSFAEAASLGCRYITSYHGVIDQGRVKPGEWVAVFGMGGVGLAAVDICAAAGANVIAITRSQEKLDLARSLGAVKTINAGDDNVVEQITEITKGGAHLSVDALGIHETCLRGLTCLRTRGRHVRLGLNAKEEGGDVALPVDLFVAKELQMIGSFGMQSAHFPGMLRQIEAGRLRPGKLVTAQVKLEQVSDVLAEMTGYNTTGVTVVTGF